MPRFGHSPGLISTTSASLSASLSWSTRKPAPASLSDPSPATQSSSVTRSSPPAPSGLARLREPVCAGCDPAPAPDPAPAFVFGAERPGIVSALLCSCATGCAHLARISKCCVRFTIFTAHRRSVAVASARGSRRKPTYIPHTGPTMHPSAGFRTIQTTTGTPRTPAVQTGGGARRTRIGACSHGQTAAHGCLEAGC